MGHAVLESYSRVLESLAAAILNRIDDVIYADNVAAKTAASESASTGNDEEDELSPGTPTSMTLLDLMSWNIDQGGEDANMNSSDFDEQSDQKIMAKIQPENKRISYLEKLENWGGLRSPTARH